MNGNDTPIRLAAFKWLEEQTAFHGDVLARKLLEDGFNYNGEKIILQGAQGIWKPRALELPLTITTMLNGPYRDSFSKDGLLMYKYRGTDVYHRDNVGLRKLMQHQIPLIYFHNVAKGRYLAVWPVYISGDDPQSLTFTVSADDINYLKQVNEFNYSSVADPVFDISRRSYITSQVKVRLHQSSFRERVLEAYDCRCTLCRLQHRELLDAAHIIPDSDPDGEPIVTNGLSLCKIHHAAFDNNILGIRPDYSIEVRSDILEENDGPMLQHGIKEMHDKKIILPRHRNCYPDVNSLEKRYDIFRKTG